MITPADEPVQTAPPRNGVKMPAFLATVLALVGGMGYQYVQIDHLKDELATSRKAMSDEIATLREASTTTVAANRQNMAKLSDELEAARRQAQMAVGQTRAEAQRKADELAKQLAAEQRRAQQVQAQVKTEIDAVKDTATTATAKIGEVSTEVGAVKTEVANTKSELDKTIADLKHATGELDGHSVLIATNAKELTALKALGERNFYEFKINKSKEAQKVGDVLLTLRKTDAKRNKFTLDLVADDKKVEKKDRTVNEAIQFYVAKAPQPYVLVINDVKKDQISGYLSTPKVQTARN